MFENVPIYFKLIKGNRCIRSLKLNTHNGQRFSPSPTFIKVRRMLKSQAHNQSLVSGARVGDVKNINEHTLGLIEAVEG